MTAGGEIDVGLADGIRMRIRGGGAAIRHFRAEYGPAITSKVAGEVDLRIAFVGRPPRGGIAFDGRHKTVSWIIRVQDTDHTMRVGVKTTGVPHSFVLSLVQGYYVETLLAVVAAERGAVLLPASAIATERGAVLVVGRSGSGKSTLCAKALAARNPIFGDDQVFVGSDGCVSGFPRRLRIYPDLAQTAPETYERLGPGYRAGLGWWKSVGAMTRGFVAPPIRVPVSALGVYAPGPSPITEIALIERAQEVPRLTVDHMPDDAAIDLVMPIIDEQREKILATSDAAWRDRVSAARRREVTVLTEALRGRRVTRYRVPAGWPAPRATAALAEELGIKRP